MKAVWVVAPATLSQQTMKTNDTKCQAEQRVCDSNQVTESCCCVILSALSLAQSLALSFVLKVASSVRLPLRTPKLARNFPHHIAHKIRCLLPNLVRITSNKEQYANKLGSRSMPLGDAGNRHEVARTSEACERAMSCAGQWKFCFSHRWPDVST